MRFILKRRQLRLVNVALPFPRSNLNAPSSPAAIFASVPPKDCPQEATSVAYARIQAIAPPQPRAKAVFRKIVGRAGAPTGNSRSANPKRDGAPPPRSASLLDFPARTSKTNAVKRVMHVPWEESGEGVRLEARSIPWPGPAGSDGAQIPVPASADTPARWDLSQKGPARDASRRAEPKASAKITGSFPE